MVLVYTNGKGVFPGNKISESQVLGNDLNVAHVGSMVENKHADRITHGLSDFVISQKPLNCANLIGFAHFLDCGCQSRWRWHVFVFKKHFLDTISARNDPHIHVTSAVAEFDSNEFMVKYY